MKKFIFPLIIIFCLPAFNASAYGPKGHRMVGAIADSLLAGTSTNKKIRAMLEGISLAEAATFADDIKSWDVVPPTKSNTFHLPHHPKIEAQLVAFWQANPPTHNDSLSRPSHHWFHFTDVPVMGKKSYAAGTIGRSQWDIVHMINFCIQVLHGDAPDSNARKITKPVALILLAHYIGDVHQPLHVGAEYFSSTGIPCDPEKEKKYFGDEGGNTLKLALAASCDHGMNKDSLHKYWDNDAVTTAFRTTVVDTAGCSPLPKINLKTCATTWANETLAIAREAYSRLTFESITFNYRTASGSAIEKKMKDGLCYQTWAGNIVHKEIIKAGARLAGMLKKV